MSKRFKEMTVVMLIDFAGHDCLGDDNMNNLRYKYLQKIAFGDDPPVVIISNHDDRHSKLNEIQKMVITENYHKWINIGTGSNNDTYNVRNIEYLLAAQEIKPRKVVIGGCNTAGCVISTKGFSAAAWANKGYDTTIFLPMCADYQQPGIDSYEKSIAAFTVLYKRIKHLKLIDKIDIQSNFEMIYLTLEQRQRTQQ